MWYGPSRLLWNAIRFPSGLSTGRRFAACVVVSCRIGEAERLEYPASSTTHAARMSARMLVRRLTSARRRATADRAHTLPGQDRRQDRHDHTTKQERCLGRQTLFRRCVRAKGADDEEVTEHEVAGCPEQHEEREHHLRPATRVRDDRSHPIEKEDQDRDHRRDMQCRCDEEDGSRNREDVPQRLDQSGDRNKADRGFPVRKRLDLFVVRELGGTGRRRLAVEAVATGDRRAYRARELPEEPAEAPPARCPDATRAARPPARAVRRDRKQDQRTADVVEAVEDVERDGCRGVEQDLSGGDRLSLREDGAEVLPDAGRHGENETDREDASPDPAPRDEETDGHAETERERYGLREHHVVGELAVPRLGARRGLRRALPG